MLFITSFDISNLTLDGVLVDKLSHSPIILMKFIDSSMIGLANKYNRFGNNAGTM
jgi:hypothetical protein